MKISTVLKTVGTLTVLSGALAAYYSYGTVTYEFPSCVPSSKMINVMRIPIGYQASGVSTLIRDDQPIGWREKEPKGQSYFYNNGGPSFTILRSTYPDYLPLGFKSWEDYSTMEYESRDSNKLLFATIDVGRSIVLSPLDNSYIHEINGKRKYPLQRVREDSVDGQYWVYPQPEQRATFPYGKVKYQPNQPTYFMPKDKEFHVFIGCRDTGINAFAPDGQCFIRSDWADDPNLSCMTVEYRIAAKDMPRWREFDVRVKTQIQSLISQRKHGDN